MKKSLLLLIPFLFAGCMQTTMQENKKPNVVMILADDQGWGDLSINGNTNLRTPNIDNLAQHGASFDRFYVCPVCSPTRAEMLTGRYHPHGGVYSTSAGGERLDLDETTIADLFKKAGYKTAAYGKWHNGMQYPYHPNARGFDDFYGFCSGHWGNYFSPPLEHNGELVKGNGFIIDDLTNHGLQFIEKNKDNPFFLYLPYNTPHSPMQVPQQWWEKFSEKEVEKLHRDPEKENLQHTRPALAMCENIDWNVGRVMKKIKQLELEENTIIIYFSDNGPNGWRWNGGMKGRKGSTDEGGVRVPFFIQWAGVIEPGKNIKQIAGAIDILPTLADLTGIQYNTNKPLDGISLKPLLLENNNEWEERLIFNHWSRRTSVRSQQYRLDNNNKLFDMVNDPGQYIDISEQNPEITKKLITAKEEWEKTVLSELPEKDTRPFPIGHPDYEFTQIPARDGIPFGNIKRSNRYPNCSFFYNWINIDDKITWDAEVLADGDFEVILYYTCPEKDIGSTFEISFGSGKLTGKITEAHDPPLTGMENDRVERIESYVKDFKPLKMGTIHLDKGKGKLTLKATDIPGSQVMDFRLMMFRKL
ncbi:MAG: arylsulfatase [Bacteroidales bacterium]|nr:arylsulfatase [Bacteroidales bacterium]